MELESIIDNALYAFRWSDEDVNALEKMAIEYSDSEFIYNFFQSNKHKLEFYTNPSYSPEQASIKTHKEVIALIKEIRELAMNGIEGRGSSLDDLFEPLHKSSAYANSRFKTDVKAKGHPKVAPWVRVYAVKCDENLYVITGYGIKLDKDMRDDPKLVYELEKLDSATTYLKRLQMISR